MNFESKASLAIYFFMVKFDGHVSLLPLHPLQVTHNFMINNHIISNNPLRDKGWLTWMNEDLQMYSKPTSYDFRDNLKKYIA